MKQYTLNDFAEEKSHHEDWRYYCLNEDSKIFGKTFAGVRWEILIYKNLKLSHYINMINEYLCWLSGDSKNEVIKYINGNIEQDEKVDSTRYEIEEIFSALIYIDANENIFSEISCVDNYFPDHALDIEFEDKKILNIHQRLSSRYRSHCRGR
jgi:hypothetical protein